MHPLPAAPPHRARTDRAASVLRRVLDVSGRVLRGLTILALVAAGAVGLAWLVWVVDAPPSDANEWIGRLVALAVLVTPPTVLLLFVAGLRELSRLPERVRSLPADVRTQARRLDDPPGGGSERRGIVLAALFRLGRLVLGSRDVLSPYSAVTIALRPAILLAAVFAALAAIVEVPAALLVILVLLD